jgi:hypothetical protein
MRTSTTRHIAKRKISINIDANLKIKNIQRMEISETTIQWQINY